MKPKSVCKKTKKEKCLAPPIISNLSTSEEKNKFKSQSKTRTNSENKKETKFSSIEQNLHEFKLLYEDSLKKKEKISLIIPVFVLFYEKQTLSLNIRTVESCILQELNNHPEQFVSTTYYKCMNQINTKNYQKIIRRLGTNSLCFCLKNNVLELKTDYLKKNMQSILKRYFSNLMKNKNNKSIVDLCKKNGHKLNVTQEEVEIMIDDDSGNFEIHEENENIKPVDILSASSCSIQNETNFIETKFGDKKLEPIVIKDNNIKSERKPTKNSIIKISCQSDVDDTSDDTDKFNLVKKEKNFDKNTFLSKKRNFFDLTNKLNNVHSPTSDELLKKIITKGGKLLKLIEENENIFKFYNYDERILLIPLNELNYQYSEFIKNFDYSIYFKKIVNTEDFPIVEKVSKINKENISKSELLIKSMLTKIRQIFIEFNFIEKDLFKICEKTDNDFGSPEINNDNNEFDENEFLEKIKNSLEQKLIEMKDCVNY